MKRYLVVALAAGLALLLAACGRAGPSPTAEATDAPVAVASPTDSSPATSAPSPQAEIAQTTPETETQATVFPTPNPNPECVAEPIPEDPNIPPPAADEWSEGPADAPLTLIEYSDFQ
jgi:PBP1b-binding outer membrane lipoprotein LpoB